MPSSTVSRAPPIMRLVAHCVVDFEVLLAILDGGFDHERHPYISFKFVDDQLLRLHRWAKETGVYRLAPRHSLDAHLRYRAGSGIAFKIYKLLRTVRAKLQNAAGIIKGEVVPWDEEDDYRNSDRYRNRPSFSSSARCAVERPKTEMHENMIVVKHSLNALMCFIKLHQLGYRADRGVAHVYDVDSDSDSDSD